MAKQKNPIDMVEDLDQDLIGAAPPKMFVSAFITSVFRDMPFMHMVPSQTHAGVLNRIIANTWQTGHDEGLIAEPLPERFRSLLVEDGSDQD